MTTQPAHRIEPGQEYETCQPTYWGSTGPEYTLIRVIEPQRVPGGRVGVATIHEDGRELRRRTIGARHLHETVAGPGGKRRKSAYYLVRHADGTPAGEAR